MATAYTEIYKRFYDKITDYNMVDFDLDTREEILESYLKSAEVEFERICQKDLTDKDDYLKQYNEDLSNKEIEILASGMLYYWYSPMVHNTDLAHNILNTKDFSTYSPANLLSSLSNIHKEIKSNFRRLMVNYSFDNADIANLGNTNN